MTQAKQGRFPAFTKQDRTAFALLALVVALGLFLRTEGIRWSLPDARHPFATYHPDELIDLNAAKSADLLHGQLDTQFYNYGTFYFYLVSFAHIVARGWGWIPETPANIPLIDPRAAPEQAALFLVGRWVTALLGTATIAVIFALGNRCYGRMAGLLGALFYAIAPLAVQHAHFLTVDVPATFFVSLALLQAARLLTIQTWRDYVLAGVTVGLAAATKYTCILVAIAPITAHLLSRRPDVCQTHRRAFFAVMGLAAGFAFIIACPGPIINWNAFWNGTYPGSGVYYELFVHSRAGHGTLFTDTLPGWLYHLVFSLNSGLGILLLIPALVGVLYGLVRRRPQDMVLLSFLLLYYFITGFSAVRFARYMLPLFPVLCLFAARLLTDTTLPRFLPKLNMAYAVVTLPATFLWAYSLDNPMVRPDVRDVAADYLEKNAPQGAIVAFATVPWFYSPPLSPYFGAPSAPARAKAAQETTRYRLRIAPSEWDSAVLAPPPDYLVLSDIETANTLDRLHDPKAEAFMEAATGAGLGNVRFFHTPTLLNNLPEDMRYPSPLIELHSRK